MREDLAPAGKSAKDVLKYIKYMNETLDIYHKFVANPPINDKAITPAMRISLRVINALPQSDIFHPFLLKLAMKFDFGLTTNSTAYERILKTVETFSVRHMICGTFKKSDVEDVFAKAIRGFKKQQYTISAILEYLNGNMPSDREFKDSFSKFSFKRGNTNICKALLRRLEATCNDGKSEELSDDSRKITLEHIMPKTIKNAKGWGHVAGYHQKYLWWIGNLTLLSDKLNKGNSSFHHKQVNYYEHSLLTLTKRLKVHKTWNKKQIRTRQKQMANGAVLTWPRKLN